MSYLDLLTDVKLHLVNIGAITGTTVQHIKAKEWM
jgi:hypothetical protein